MLSSALKIVLVNTGSSQWIAHISLMCADDFMTIYSVPSPRLLVSLHLHLISGKRPRSDDLRLRMPSG